MHSTRRFLIASAITAVLSVTAFGAAGDLDGDEPEITDRVARISYVSGKVSIRRAGSDEWEIAVTNLPVMEGDELSTEAGALLEIQFDASTHARVASNSYLKIATLGDGGIAFSLAEGSISITAKKFDPEKAYIEIDAPRSTVSVQRSGRYRVDAGSSGSEEIRVGVYEDGEARIYASNSGFTLRSGRTARIFIEGNFAGEWESGFASVISDEFDQWVADRSAEIARRLNGAYYGRYYDEDIYGAEELNDNGEWVHTRDYGYIWRPFRTSLSRYSNWSPYRYGHWRWLPVYGWTWVNDEPWGWATYHHGRWIWYNGSWYWSPYSYHRLKRSWWYPALIVLRVIDRSVCWYPLPYNRSYYNFNRHHYARNPRPPRNNQDRPIPAPTPALQIQLPVPEEPPFEKYAVKSEVPDGSVISMPIDDFGRRIGIPGKLPPQVGRRVISTEPIVSVELPKLPNIGDIRTKGGTDLRVEPPSRGPINIDDRAGAVKRDPGKPLDLSLRNKIIRGDRPVIVPEPGNTSPRDITDRKMVPATGAVGRPSAVKIDPGRSEPQREPQREPQPRYDLPRQKQEPQVEPVKRELPRYGPPKSDNPAAMKEPVWREPVKRSDPPPSKPLPRAEPSRKSEPPPRKTETVKPPVKAETRKKDDN